MPDIPSNVRPTSGLERKPPAIDSSVANNSGGTAGVKINPAPPQSRWQIQAALLNREYTSSSGFLWLANYIRSLPHWIDDVTRDFGTDLPDKMLQDAQINSCIRLLTIAVLEDGIELDPAVSDKPITKSAHVEDISSSTDSYGKPVGSDSQQDADSDLARDICDWWTSSLRNMERPLEDILYEMMPLAYGNRVGELIWETRKDIDGRFRLHLKTIKTKPREVTAFVVDAYMNLLGLLGMIPGQGWPVQTGTVVGDPAKLPNMLPKEKFFILTWGMKNNDPRGTSLLRPVYNAWWLKTQTWGQYEKYLVQFASGSIVGFLPPNAVPRQQTDDLGNPIPGAPLIRPEDEYRQTLEDVHNGSVAVFPNGTVVQFNQAQGAGNAVFNGAIQLFNQEIAKGILCQILATEMTPHQSRAAAQTQENVLDEVVAQAKMIIVNQIRRQILYRGTLYNWGKEIADRLTPVVRSSQTEGHNWATDAGAAATLGFKLDPSQFQAIDSMLGLPARDPDSITAAQQAAGGTPPQPGEAPGQPPPANLTDQSQEAPGASQEYGVPVGQ